MSATFSRLGLEADISLPKGETPTLETAALTGSAGRLTVEDIRLTDAKLDAMFSGSGPRLELSGQMMELPGEPEGLAADHRCALTAYR